MKGRACGRCNLNGRTIAAHTTTNANRPERGILQREEGESLHASAVCQQASLPCHFASLLLRIRRKRRRTVVVPRRAGNIVAGSATVWTEMLVALYSPWCGTMPGV